MTELLKTIPIWIWAMIPAVALGFITYFVTHRTQFAIKLGGISLLVAWATTGFHFWEVFLHNHFVGGFNTYGLPANFSRTGWHLLIDAWPLWLIPTVFAIIIATAAIFTWQAWQFSQLIKYPATNETKEKAKKKLKGKTTSSHMLRKIDVIKLEQQVTYLKEKLKEQKQGRGKQNEGSEKSHMLTELKQQVKKLKGRNTELERKTTTLNTDLKQAKTLIEQLLEEQYGTQ